VKPPFVGVEYNFNTLVATLVLTTLSVSELVNFTASYACVDDAPILYITQVQSCHSVGLFCSGE